MVAPPPSTSWIRTVDGALARLIIVAVGALLVTVLLPGLQLIDPLPGLVAAAAVCVTGLARTRSPSLAWLAAIGGAWAAALLPIVQARDASPLELGVDRWLPWALAAGSAAATTLWIAADYATRPGRRIEPVAVPVAIGLVGWFCFAVVLTIGAAFAGQQADPAFTWVDVAAAPIAWVSIFLLGLLGLGIAADVRAAVTRAREARTDGGVAALVGASLRELVPGTRAAEEARATAERRDLAGDLHASVVPSLRRAIDEAEGNADPAIVLRHLRAADLELERLMADRWPIVLETFGLVAALEDLAERLEAGGSPPISIGVEGAETRPSQQVERAAWRFVQVALDNAVRHAAATAIEARVAISSASLRVTVEDDGRGFDPERPVRGRGLADVRGAATEVGALVSVAALRPRGTSVDFRWPARGAS